MSDEISMTEMKANGLRLKHSGYSSGFWNVWNMSNRQIINTFDRK